jgi:predicted phage terminase large subunit-like protein
MRLELPYRLEQKVLFERSFHDFYRASWRFIDPAPFIDGRHFQCLSEHLEAVVRGQITRLIINIQPRVSKSTLCSVAFPSWVWALNDPLYSSWPLAGADKKILSLSYAQKLSTRDSRRSRQLINSRWYQNLWGEEFCLTSDQNEKMRYDNDRQGFRMATTPLGQVLGEGGDIVLFDDPHKASDMGKERHWQTIEFIQETLPTRLNSDKSAVIVIMQRLHEKDASGVLAETGNYTHVCLPAEYDPTHKYHFVGDWRKTLGELLWPEKIDKQALEIRKRDMTQYAISGQLQQLPVPREGGMFKADWFKFVDRLPDDVRLNGRCVRFYDMASSEVSKANRDPDFTVGVKMWLHEGVYYIDDVVRFRLSALDVEKRIQSAADMDGFDCYVRMEQEGGSSGKISIDHYAREVLADYNFKGIKSTGSKEKRAELLEARAQNGNVYLVRAPWNAAFIEEMTLFPNGAHDDQVDAASGACNELPAIMRNVDRNAVAVPVQVKS